MNLNKLLLVALLALSPALHAEDSAKTDAPKAEKKAGKTEKKEEAGKVHSDPRFKGKVMVMGASSANFGEAPKDNDLTTRGIALEPEDAAPKPLPEAPPAKKK